jgi:(p)ppGpp synthase/HD superfamily hydrolase
VVSGRAKSSIRQWFAKERREEALEQGKDLITREVRRGRVPVHRIFSESLAGVSRELGFVDVTALYTAIGENHVSAKTVVGRLVAAHGGVDEVTEELADRSRDKTITPPRTTTSGAGVLVGGVEDVHAKLARCCTPVPGDHILGFITRGGSVSVHRTDCTNASDLHREPERLVKVSGRRSRVRSSSWPSRWRLSTATDCCRTSPRSWPTRRSTSCPRQCRPPATTGWRSRGSPSRWPTPSTWDTSSAPFGSEGVFDVYRMTSN